jgi:uncharacterized membrane protein YfhO
VDGRAVPVYPANGLFQAIAVPAGVHRVRWVYFPSSLIAGGIVTLLGVAGLVGAACGAEITKEITKKGSLARLPLC